MVTGENGGVKLASSKKAICGVVAYPLKEE